MLEATILHADVDAFYASVEQRDDPRLRGRPVVVGAGVVLAASYEAKAYGVRTAMGGALARRLCPQAAVVAPRMSAYAEASSESAVAPIKTTTTGLACRLPRQLRIIPAVAAWPIATAAAPVRVARSTMWVAPWRIA